MVVLNDQVVSLYRLCLLSGIVFAHCSISDWKDLIGIGGLIWSISSEISETRLADQNYEIFILYKHRSKWT